MHEGVRMAADGGARRAPGQRRRRRLRRRGAHRYRRGGQGCWRTRSTNLVFGLGTLHELVHLEECLGIGRIKVEPRCVVVARCAPNSLKPLLEVQYVEVVQPVRSMEAAVKLVNELDLILGCTVIESI